jgi:hypothetical protein
MKKKLNLIVILLVFFGSIIPIKTSSNYMSIRLQKPYMERVASFITNINDVYFFMEYNDSLNTKENRDILLTKVVNNYRNKYINYSDSCKREFMYSLFSEENIKLALREQELYNIPASVTLAQMYVESKESRRYRMSVLATKANNYFGIKYYSNNLIKDSYTVYTEEEFTPSELKQVKRKYIKLYNVKGKVRIRLKQNFAKFEKVEDAFRVHSLVINKYNITGDNYKDWTYGLVKHNYATAWQYAILLNTIIERYHLHELDYIKS